MVEWHDSWQYPRGLTLYGGDPYIAGAKGDSSADAMVVLTYEYGATSTDFRWSRGFNSNAFDEGRAVAVENVDGANQRSVYVVGVTTVTGEGRQFTVWRYREED